MLVKVAIERGEFQLQFHGNVILRAELAYPVRPENVPPEEYFEGTKLELEGVVNPKLITCTLDHEWEFVETPKFIRDRCIQIPLHKVVPPHITVWFKRFFNSESTTVDKPESYFVVHGDVENQLWQQYLRSPWEFCHHLHNHKFYTLPLRYG
uniref:Proline--tRNA ligase n=1 Tax=Lygus hesperus TaxID=30085 RepID=A0A0A9WUB4_LYGHE